MIEILERNKSTFIPFDKIIEITVDEQRKALYIYLGNFDEVETIKFNNPATVRKVLQAFRRYGFEKGVRYKILVGGKEDIRVLHHETGEAW
ncbi:MAG TPA: hypothetical protein ENF81_05835 [Thermotogaceae bacterium]|nr:hypothetical protein [Thermotogaceae bacterium]